ncbi:hypothetical protein COOONC_23060 [Cooperia oncophora]
MTFLRFFLLLSSFALIVWGDRNVDSNDLLKQMFGITRDESKSMEDLQQRFVDDHGNINKNQVVDVDLGPGEGSKRTKDPLFTVQYQEASMSDSLRETTDDEKQQALEHGFELL